MIVVNDYDLLKDVFAPLNLTNDFIINIKPFKLRKRYILNSMDLM